MTDRYVPIDADAEAAVLGALLSSPELFDEVSDLLAPEDFGMTGHQLTYQAILNVDAAGKPVDQITVAAELKKGRYLTKVGGIEALARLVELSSDAGNVVAWAQIVQDKSRLRQLHSAARDIAGASLDPQAAADDVLEQAQQKVFALGERRGRSTMLAMSQAIPKTLETLARARTSVLIGQPTSIEGLDRMTAGLQGGQLVIVAGRPAMGKSSFALQMASHLAMAGDEGVVPFLSYEMSVTELGMRLLSHSLAYDLHRLRQGDIPYGMEKELAAASETLSASTLLIDDNPPETVGGVRSAMRRLARKQRIKAIFVDYLQLMSAERRGRDDNRTQEVSDISRGLKRLATELDVPIVALSQLNRSLEGRPNKRPMLSDLRESGSLEQDSSAVLFLYRPSVYDPVADKGVAECIIAKQRNGPVGTVPLAFDPSCGRWKDSPFTGNGAPF